MAHDRPKILFISRAFPPIVGGIENQNYELSASLPEHAEVKTIANRFGKKALPLFLPWMMIYTLLFSSRYDAILLGDGVLGVVGWWIKKFFPQKRVICVVHGLDITYESPLYQKYWIGHFLPLLDLYIAVGNQTRDICTDKGLSPERVVFVPNGVSSEKFISYEGDSEDLATLLGKSTHGKQFILTSGRLARRKGVAWFVENVLPELPQNVSYVVAGDGPDRKNIEAAIEKSGMESRVHLLGYVSDEERLMLFHKCDLFVQPNIVVEGDIEGFGISVIEAAVSGIPVVASHLEGLKDAIKDRENGFSVASGDMPAWRSKVLEVLGDDFDRQAFGLRAQDYVIKHYNWETIAHTYVDVITKTNSGSQKL